MRLTVLLLFLSISSQSPGQSVVRGIILDRENSAPIPFASLYIPGTSIGTISNNEGQFRLILPKGATQVRISCVGYKRKELSVTPDQATYQIYLEKEEHLLNEVIISPKNYAEKLVRAAISNIPNNYPTSTESLQVFLREYAYADSSQTQPYYVVEALLNTEKKSYAKKNDGGVVALDQMRKHEFEMMDSLPQTPISYRNGI